MSNGYIGLTPDSSGKKLRTRKVTEDGNETHDEVVRLSNTTDTTINPATEDGNLATIAGKDFATQTTLALVKAKTDNLDTALSGIKTGTDKIPSSPATVNDSYPVGSGSNGTVTLTSASTAYAVPVSASTKNNILIIYNGSDTDMYWGFATLTTGGILLPSSSTTAINLGANQTIFAYCTAAGKVINYTYKEVN